MDLTSSAYCLTQIYLILFEYLMELNAQKEECINLFSLLKPCNLLFLYRDQRSAQVF